MAAALTIGRAAVALLALLVALAAAPAEAADDRFIAGYATAVLEREFELKAVQVDVQAGVVTLYGEIESALRERVVRALQDIEGVKGVTLAEGAGPMAEAAPAPLPPEAAAPHGEEEKGELFPKGRLFAPLFADPRWPHFSAAYHYYFNDRELESVGATSFGETLIFYRGDSLFGEEGGQWEIGIQGGVFAIFDLDRQSKDLINADYWVGIPFSYRYKDFSGLLRVFHQSSHLGDEFLLRSRLNRVNLSYESVDLKLSYDIGPRLRVYAGPGYIFHKEPSDLKPWSVQYGIEFTAPWPRFGGTVQPLAAADLKNWEENNWRTDVSLRLGLQFERPTTIGQRFQIMLEYFRGNSPNGQFYNRSIQYMGLGAHFYF